MASRKSPRGRKSKSPKTRAPKSPKSPKAPTQELPAQEPQELLPREPREPQESPAREPQEPEKTQEPEKSGELSQSTTTLKTVKPLQTWRVRFVCEAGQLEEPHHGPFRFQAPANLDEEALQTALQEYVDTEFGENRFPVTTPIVRSHDLLIVNFDCSALQKHGGFTFRRSRTAKYIAALLAGTATLAAGMVFLNEYRRKGRNLLQEIKNTWVGDTLQLRLDPLGRLQLSVGKETYGVLTRTKTALRLRANHEVDSQDQTWVDDNVLTPLVEVANALEINLEIELPVPGQWPLVLKQYGFTETESHVWTRYRTVTIDELHDRLLETGEVLENKTRAPWCTWTLNKENKENEDHLSLHEPKEGTQVAKIEPNDVLTLFAKLDADMPLNVIDKLIVMARRANFRTLTLHIPGGKDELRSLGFQQISEDKLSRAILPSQKEEVSLVSGFWLGREHAYREFLQSRVASIVPINDAHFLQSPGSTAQEFTFIRAYLLNVEDTPPLMERGGKFGTCRIRSIVEIALFAPTTASLQLADGRWDAEFFSSRVRAALAYLQQQNFKGKVYSADTNPGRKEFYEGVGFTAKIGARGQLNWEKDIV